VSFVSEQLSTLCRLASPLSRATLVLGSLTASRPLLSFGDPFCNGRAVLEHPGRPLVDLRRVVGYLPLNDHRRVRLAHLTAAPVVIERFPMALRWPRWLETNDPLVSWGAVRASGRSSIERRRRQRHRGIQAVSPVSLVVSARRNRKPLLGLPAGALGSLMSAISYPALLRRGIASPCLLLSCGVGVGESRASLERSGRSEQSPRQLSCDLAHAKGCTLGIALVAREPALRGRVLPETPRVLTSAELFQPIGPFSLPRRLELNSESLTLISETFTPICGRFTVVCDLLALVRDPVALVRDPVALVRNLLTLMSHPLSVGCDRWRQPRLSVLTTSLALVPDPAALLL
jgi:hypothetical protein